MMEYGKDYQSYTNSHDEYNSLRHTHPLPFIPFQNSDIRQSVSPTGLHDQSVVVHTQGQALTGEYDSSDGELIYFTSLQDANADIDRMEIDQHPDMQRGDQNKEHNIESVISIETEQLGPLRQRDLSNTSPSDPGSRTSLTQEVKMLEAVIDIPQISKGFRLPVSAVETAIPVAKSNEVEPVSPLSIGNEPFRRPVAEEIVSVRPVGSLLSKSTLSTDNDTDNGYSHGPATANCKLGADEREIPFNQLNVAVPKLSIPFKLHQVGRLSQASESPYSTNCDSHMEPNGAFHMGKDRSVHSSQQVISDFMTSNRVDTQQHMKFQMNGPQLIAVLGKIDSNNIISPGQRKLPDEKLLQATFESSGILRDFQGYESMKALPSKSFQVKSSEVRRSVKYANMEREEDIGMNTDLALAPVSGQSSHNRHLSIPIDRAKMETTPMNMGLGAVATATGTAKTNQNKIYLGNANLMPLGAKSKTARELLQKLTLDVANGVARQETEMLQRIGSNLSRSNAVQLYQRLADGDSTNETFEPNGRFLAPLSELDVHREQRLAALEERERLKGFETSPFNDIATQLPYETVPSSVNHNDRRETRHSMGQGALTKAERRALRNRISQAERESLPKKMQIECLERELNIWRDKRKKGILHRKIPSKLKVECSRLVKLATSPAEITQYQTTMDELDVAIAEDRVKRLTKRRERMSRKWAANQSPQQDESICDMSGQGGNGDVKLFKVDHNRTQSYSTNVIGSVKMPQQDQNDMEERQATTILGAENTATQGITRREGYKGQLPQKSASPWTPYIPKILRVERTQNAAVFIDLTGSD